jgi:hypothetical protein
MRRVLSLALLGVLICISARAEQPLRDFIDSEVSNGWKSENVKPAAAADDATFLRRVHLDLTGTIPTADEAKKFLDDTSKDKRDKLIERLLADPRFAQQMTDVWDLAMFGRDAQDPFRKRDEFRAWLNGKFKKNEPYDKLVKQILLGEEDGSETFLAHYRYRVEDATEAVSRLFLGTQLQCARCHDHPYEEWKQKDFYAMAGFLVRIVVQESGSGQKQRFKIAEKSSGEVLFSGSVKDARPGKKGDPVAPKFLGGKALDEPPLPKDFKEPDYRTAKTLPKPPFSRKQKLAEWVTAKDNPYFARAAVNRVWGQFMGRGLVHPVDDLTSKSEPTLPALLKRLTEDFAKHDFDLKWLVKEIVSSKSYQLSDKGDSKVALPVWYERARVRPLTAEELLSAMRTATAFDASGGNIKNTATREYFLMYFGKPTNGQGDFQGSLREHLFLNNSGDVSALIRRRKGNLADEIATSTDSLEKRVDRLFLAVLTRQPSAKEREKFVAHLKTDDKRKTDALIEEAIWALLNTAEFRFNR